MPSLKEYRERIATVRSTRKITSAMKMVAASKLKKAQEAAEASQPYARAMDAMMRRVASGLILGPSSPRLLIGTGADRVHLLVVVTSDRGLCGGFNGNVVRRTRAEIHRLEDAGKTVRLICIGRKGRDGLRREFGERVLESFVHIGGQDGISYAEIDRVCTLILEQFESGGFDVCKIISNKFINVLTQIPDVRQVIPLSLDPVQDNAPADKKEPHTQKDGYDYPYAFEPSEESILERLLPRNLGIQLYRAVLDSAAGEQAARMTAMDNATNNANDMISDLALQYNRARQAFITKELIEIISGAEAV